MKKVVCVIAAHPDDEVLGCGGAMARYRDQGYDVHVLIVAQGIGARFNNDAHDQVNQAVSQLQIQAQQAHHVLRSSSLTFASFPDNRLDSVDLLDIVKTIEQFLDQHHPTIIFTHHAGDVNIDHRIVNNAVMAACRPIGDRRMLEMILLFEVPSSTEWHFVGSLPAFNPQCFIAIDQYLERKLQSLRCYDAEMRPFPHARSYEAVEHLARWRGVTAGCKAAEAFVVARLSL